MNTSKNQIAFKGGSYSLMISAIVLSLLLVINIMVSSLPASLTTYDISASQLYSVTSNTKTVVNALEDEVTIYWIVQSGAEDMVIENLLAKYESLSSNIEVVKRNPDVYPTFAEQYTDEVVQNNSLVVVSGDSSRYIAYDDIYLVETDLTSYTQTTSFDGEGAITSAIDYVTSEDFPQLYVLEGHGELELSETFSDQITKENIEVQYLSLLTVDSIPEDADAIMIHAPTSDISVEEKEMLAEYVANGGKLLVVSGAVADDDLENLNSLLSDYGITMVEGVVIEEDRNYYALSQPSALLPDMAEDEITESLIESNYNVIVPAAQGMTIDGTYTDGTITELLYTSDTAFSKIAGYSLTTYEKEDDDIDGPFTVGLSVETSSGGGMIWFSSSYFLDESYNSLSSGANGDLAMNALSSLIGESETMAIRSKSLNYNYLTISDATASLLQKLMIGVFPLTYVAIGVAVIWRKRRRQNEAS